MHRIENSLLAKGMNCNHLVGFPNYVFIIFFDAVVNITIYICVSNYYLIIVIILKFVCYLRLRKVLIKYLKYVCALKKKYIVFASRRHQPLPKF